MGWADYHRAAPAGLDLDRAVARARRVVASCAIGDVRVETTLEEAYLDRLQRLAARPLGVGQQVTLRLFPDDILAVAAAARRAGTAVVLQGRPRAPGVQVDLHVGPEAVVLELFGGAPDAVREVLVGAVDLGLLPASHLAALPADLPRDLRFPAALVDGWPTLWLAGPTALRVRASGDDALQRACALWEVGGEDSMVELWIQLDGEAAVDALVAEGWPSPCCVAWWCGFDDYGAAYHGVRLALHGRHQDGGVATPAADHDLVLLVSGKRRDNDALVARLQRQSGVEWTRDGSGL